jgi:opacity protein-like surface antigen
MLPRARRRFPAIPLLVLALCLLASHDAAALSPHKRTGVMLGGAFGFSPGKVSLFPGNEELAVQSGWEIGVTPRIQIGYALIENRLVLAAANQQWLYEQGILADDKLRINAQNWSLVLNYYPGNPQTEAGGLYFFAGVGYANARLTLLEPLEDDPYGNKFEEVYVSDEQGIAYQVGMGFEFRLTTNFAAGISVGYVYQDIGGEIFDKTAALPSNLTLNWYF